MQSGNSKTPWATTTKAATAVYDTASLLGINATSTLHLKNRLKLVDWEQLVQISTIAYSRLVGANPVQGLAFAPVIEPNHPGAVITRTPDDVLNSGDFNLTPMLMGYNSMEGVDFPLQVAFSTYFTITQLASEGLVPKSFNITDPVLLKEVGDVLKAYYFGDLSAVTFTDYQAIPYIGDLYFVIDAIQTAQIASRFTKVFFYVFS
ncbi:esterase, partial [Oryctes borbonicus]